MGITECGKGTKLVAIAEKRGKPVGVFIASASHPEVSLIQPTWNTCIVSELLRLLIAGKAYDSDPGSSS